MLNKKSRVRIQLLNGCSCSQFSVHPSNWDQSGTKVIKDWYIFYRFYDPAFKDHSKYLNGKLCLVKGMNEYKTLTERRSVTKGLLDQEKDLIINKGYNPITTQFMKEPEDVTDYIIHPSTPLIEALSKAANNIEVARDTKKDVRSVLKYFSAAAAQLHMDKKPVEEIKKRHIRIILDQTGANKGEKWTSNNFNFYRSHLMMLFKELVDCETIEFNPVEAIRKKKTFSHGPRKTLTNEERIRIDSELRKDNYRFWRLMNIFFHSGSRSSELRMVRYEDVDLKRQVCKYTIRKGKCIRIVERPIKDIVLHLWEQVMVEAKPGQYLFSKGLCPGDVPIAASHLTTRRWKRWVKAKYNIEADWYPLKHLNTDEMDEIYGSAIAAKLNEHSEAMTVKYYAGGHKKRQQEIIKKANNAFVPSHPN